MASISLRQLPTSSSPTQRIVVAVEDSWFTPILKSIVVAFQYLSFGGTPRPAAVVRATRRRPGVTPRHRASRSLCVGRQLPCREGLSPHHGAIRRARHTWLGASFVGFPARRGGKPGLHYPRKFRAVACHAQEDVCLLVTTGTSKLKLRLLAYARLIS